jgi:hypothetical protein
MSSGISLVCVTAGPSTKLFAWGGGDMEGHVLRETTSRGLCGLGCPSRTSERGGEGTKLFTWGGIWEDMCVCLLLQDLVQSCLHGGGGG